MAIDWKKAQPGPKALWQAVHSQFPQTRLLGIYAARNVRGTQTPSAHAEGRALDIGLRADEAGEKALGDQLFAIFIRNAREAGIEHVIWNREIWSDTRGGPRGYTGVSPHTDHIHLAFSRDGSQRTTFPRLQLELATLRTGYEELGQAMGSVG